MVWLGIIFDLFLTIMFESWLFTTRTGKITFNILIIALFLWTIYYHLSEGLSFIGCLFNFTCFALLLALNVLYLNSGSKKTIRLNQ